jgi:hypothetical protein
VPTSIHIGRAKLFIYPFSPRHHTKAIFKRNKPVSIAQIESFSNWRITHITYEVFAHYGFRGPLVVLIFLCRCLQP